MPGGRTITAADLCGPSAEYVVAALRAGGAADGAPLPLYIGTDGAADSERRAAELTEYFERRRAAASEPPIAPLVSRVVRLALDSGSGSASRRAHALKKEQKALGLARKRSAPPNSTRSGPGAELREGRELGTAARLTPTALAEGDGPVPAPYVDTLIFIRSRYFMYAHVMRTRRSAFTITSRHTLTTHREPHAPRGHNAAKCYLTVA